jgi:hypothetical protein
VRALVRTVDGVFEVDLDEEEVLGLVEAWVEPEPVSVSLPLVLAAASSGSTVIAVVDRRPPLAVSNDARNRLYLSTDGARFWQALTPELPEIEAVSLTA